jgi:RNA-directed DNA polymerase
MQSTRQTFLGFSYGFRPRRSQHDALDALAFAINRTKVNWIWDADLQILRLGLTRMAYQVRGTPHRRPAHHPPDTQMAESRGDGRRQSNATVEVGTPQGSVASPLLANIYLHYVFDLWADRWRNVTMPKGNVIFVRYADDIVAGFEHEADAKRFHADAQQRMEAVCAVAASGKDSPDRIRPLRGRESGKRGLGKPETFNFLGFTHICGRSRQGKFQLKRKTRRDRMRGRLQKIKEELRRRRHLSIPEQGKWLRQVVIGYFAYHAVPTNSRRISAFRHYVVNLWRQALKRRSQKDRTTWERIRSESLRTGCPPRASFILGLKHASPSNTQGGSPVRELRSLGSVRGVLR